MRGTPMDRASRLRFLRPENVGKKRGSSTTAPTRSMTWGSWAGTWSPKSRISPLVGRVSPSSILIVVVLPEPLGPRNPCTPPGGR